METPVPQIGDVVVLRSGGPRMSVVGRFVQRGFYMNAVTWFNGCSLNRDVFPADVLRVYERSVLSAVIDRDPGDEG